MRFFENNLVTNESDQTAMQVLGAGLPRCATSSLQAALEQIGLTPCMHFAHIAPNAERGDIVLAALREHNTARRHKLLYKLFAGFQATTDWPASVFMDDLMDMYPDAKIVLNKRPGGGHQWVKSIQVLTFAASPVYHTLCVLWKTDRNVSSMWYDIIELYQKRMGLTADELLTVKHYEVHNAWIRAEAAKRGRDILEFEPRDGWEPLCVFLGKEAPKDEPFPHKNDAAEVRKVVRILYARGVISWLALGAVIFGTVRWLQLF